MAKGTTDRAVKGVATTKKTSARKMGDKIKGAKGGGGHDMWYVGAGVVAFLAVLICSAHGLKRAKRAARRRLAAMTEEERAEEMEREAAQRWVVGEDTMLAIAVGSLLLVRMPS